MISRRNAILLTLFGIFLGGILVYLSPTFKNLTLNIEFSSHTPSIVIAVCALVVTVWQLNNSIKHNKLNMLPRLQVLIHSPTQDPKNNELFEIRIINNGLGPAEIDKAYFEYTKENKIIPFNLDVAGMDRYIQSAFMENTDSEDVGELLKAVHTNYIRRPYRIIESLAKEQLISANEKICIMKLSIPSPELVENLSDEDMRTMRNQAKAALKATRIIIKYNSLYGDSFTFEDFLQH
ncbi:MAG: hypothetical protein CMH21_13580 [Methylophaga sp.]|jgi:hypothetical protein|nr:hypothetical protein [Methylophaga sp.]MAY18751.1 hypothetical protein [Methylophaga sp.]HAO25509.1 hypothetical protein [Methylophaga sp.]HCD04456.1 hypothetical protein [Methylophaga sp.]|tara:strand:- start:32623 stop:33330 length:708 start_codon:yes stop_codon:yes gene_type:complete